MKAYLDNGATTKVDPEVVKTMLPYFTEEYGNPSSIHSLGTRAAEAINRSRKIIASSIGAKPNEIVFTSGGTESDNLAIKGAAESKGKGRIITSNIEHPAVQRTVEHLEKKGYKAVYLSVDKDGLVNPLDVERAINKDTILVSIMHANNEIGTIEPIKEIGEICKKHNVLFHIDAVQSFTKVPIDVRDINVDLISFSSHKIHGPKGVGALYIRDGVKLEKQADGGSHEFNLRAGTENTPGIVGFAKAVELTKPEDVKHMTELREYIIKEVMKNIKDVKLNGHPVKRLCNNINLTFDGVEGESLLLLLDNKGISVSTGSACSSKSMKPSHVLSAIGLKPEKSHGSIRVTLSRYSTKEEADYFVKSLAEIVEKLRRMNPLK